MGVSTDGIIAYGVACSEDELPWDEFDHDIEMWWAHVKGYQSIHEPFDENGNYAEGWSKDDPRFDEHDKHLCEWRKANPLPVSVENYCSEDYPMHAIVIPESVKRCSRGFPEKFDPRELIGGEDWQETLLAFLNKYGIEYEDEPGWLLMSYWG